MPHHLEPADGVVAVAIDNDKNIQHAARWAISNLLSNKNNKIILIHVRKHHQTGDLNGTPSAGHDESIDGAPRLFKAFRAYCVRKGVQAKDIVLDNNDVCKALLDYIHDNMITNIVLGASTRRSQDVPTIIMKSAPGFCSVYVVENDKVQSVRPAVHDTLYHQTMQSYFPKKHSGSEEEVREVHRMERFGRILDRSTSSSFNLSFRGDKSLSSRHSIDDDTDFPHPPTSGSIEVTTQNTDFSSSPESGKEETHSSSSKDIKAEMRRLKRELKQNMEMYNTACIEAVTAKQKAKEIRKWKLEEARRFEQARLAQEEALELAKMERAKSRAAMKAAEKAQKLAEMEAERRKYAELKAKKEAKAKNRALKYLSNNDVRYRKYTLEEIEAATNNFSNSLKIGEGGYGPVYRGMLDHTQVAIKVLRPGAAQGKKQFKQEVMVLSRMRHPNMVLLLGACPQYGCLVYEYMNYGSLEDRLFRKGNTPPISWRKRFKIAAEIATGLQFMHSAKPEPLVHRDLKPANILLNHNYVCKISDVGLSRLVPPSVADGITQYCLTSAAGTFCYIDPEYQQSGKLVVKSDIYSLGILLLQILTARPPMGLTHPVKRSIEEGTFAELLDPSVPDWPVEKALTFAKIALQCAELQKKDRPDLGSVVLPELNRLRELGRNIGNVPRSPNPSPPESSSSDGHVSVI